LSVHFGVGNGTEIDAVEIHWPSGRVDKLAGVGVNGLVNVVEGMTLAPVQFRINAGGAAFTESSGKQFVADEQFVAGAAGYLGGTGLRDYFTADVEGTLDDSLYHSARSGASFSYDLAGLPVGRYEVTLYFTETAAGNVGQRLFDVSAEGGLVLDDFDIFAEAGGRKIAHQETLRVDVLDGQLDLDFNVVVGNRAIVHGIAVRQVEFRLNAGGGDYTTLAGDLFAADLELLAGGVGFTGGTGLPQYYNGDVLGTDDDPLYQSVHAGPAFGYTFDDIANGTYDVTLFFVDTASSAAGQRQFDVSAEGVVVLDNFDIFAAAGGRRVAHQETFQTTVVDGQLNLDFSLVVGTRALVHGIEVRIAG
ncbi:MAG: malectin domain-containing carbohydrate-binding protein, partial [Thermoanaerobaculia bacterium]